MKIRILIGDCLLCIVPREDISLRPGIHWGPWKNVNELNGTFSANITSTCRWNTTKLFVSLRQVRWKWWLWFCLGKIWKRRKYKRNKITDKSFTTGARREGVRSEAYVRCCRIFMKNALKRAILTFISIFSPPSKI